MTGEPAAPVVPQLRIVEGANVRSFQEMLEALEIFRPNKCVIFLLEERFWGCIIRIIYTLAIRNQAVMLESKQWGG